MGKEDKDIMEKLVESNYENGKEFVDAFVELNEIKQASYLLQLIDEHYESGIELGKELTKMDEERNDRIMSILKDERLTDIKKEIFSNIKKNM